MATMNLSFSCLFFSAAVQSLEIPLELYEDKTGLALACLFEMAKNIMRKRSVRTSKSVKIRREHDEEEGSQTN